LRDGDFVEVSLVAEMECKIAGHILLSRVASDRGSAVLAQPLKSPFGGGEAWMALELVPGAMEGVECRGEYSPPFGSLE